MSEISPEGGLPARVLPEARYLLAAAFSPPAALVALLQKKMACLLALPGIEHLPVTHRPKSGALAVVASPSFMCTKGYLHTLPSLDVPAGVTVVGPAQLTAPWGGTSLNTPHPPPTHPNTHTTHSPSQHTSSPKPNKQPFDSNARNISES